jgi:DNA-directed RNA polymerase subunit RPC12/RpoP
MECGRKRVFVAKPQVDMSRYDLLDFQLSLMHLCMRCWKRLNKDEGWKIRGSVCGVEEVGFKFQVLLKSRSF